MLVIAVISSKGGGGKSTIAWNLAVLLASKDYNVAIADLESIHTCAIFSEQRKLQQESMKNLPSVAVHSMPIDGIYNCFQKLIVNYDIVIIDADPLRDKTINGVIQFANFILVPVYSSPVDLFPAFEFIDRLEKEVIYTGRQIPTRVLINSFNSKTTMGQYCRNQMIERGLPLFNQTIANRGIYNYTYLNGLAISEMIDQKGRIKDYKACQELLSFFSEFMGYMNEFKLL